MSTDDGAFDSYLLSGKALDKYFSLQEALFAFSELFKYGDESDRSIAIVGGAFLDTLLEHILVAFLVDDEKEVAKLLKYDQPLGTYGGRITMIYSLGLFNDIIRDDLRIVGKIRNRFAHDLFATFEDNQIKAWCDALKWHKIAFVANPPKGAKTRDLFQVGVNQLVTHLHGIVSVARSHKRKAKKYK